MCYIELKNEKYETLEDLKRLLHSSVGSFLIEMYSTAVIQFSKNRWLVSLSKHTERQYALME